MALQNENNINHELPGQEINGLHKSIRLILAKAEGGVLKYGLGLHFGVESTKKNDYVKRKALKKKAAGGHVDRQCPV